MNLLSFLYWNPPKEVFTIPIINRPVAWYGLFFALGFFIGYYILLKLVRGYILSSPYFTSKDIGNYARFLMTLKNKSSHPFLKNFLESMPVSLKEKVAAWNLNVPIDESFALELKCSLNEFLEKAPSNLETSLSHSEIPFLQKYLSRKTEIEKRRASFRLFFEKLFPCSLVDFNERAKLFVEKLSLYVLVGTVIGARLGHLVFYEDFSFYIKNPLEIFKVWEGGLASHGGALGIIVALAFFIYRQGQRLPNISFVRLIDFVVIPTSFAAVLIRIGNFFNQEILGTKTQFFLGVFFANPLDKSGAFVRHPAQLYEAACYLGVFFFLAFLANKKEALNQVGKLSGWFFILIFGSRFLIEFIKEEQSVHAFTGLNMGQLLSIPVIILGFFLLLSANKRRKKASLAQV